MFPQKNVFGMTFFMPNPQENINIIYNFTFCKIDDFYIDITDAKCG